MFPEPVEASIDLLLHLFHRFRRRVPDLLFDIAVAVLFRIQFRRIGRKPFDTDLSFRRQILFDDTRAIVEICRLWLLRRKKGGCRRGAQVRAGRDWKLNPVSSTKTINACRRLAFF
jgi:hypothetical protein